MSVQDFAAAGITFRDATVADAKDLNELYNSIIGEETSLEWNEKRPLAEHEFYLDWMIQNDYPCILVYEGDVLIGYGSLERWIVGDEGVISFFTARFSICILQAYRRNGIAACLWRELVVHRLTKKRQLYIILCQLLTCNPAAIRLVKSLGFNYQGQLTDIALKKGRRCSHVFFSRTIGTSPNPEQIEQTGFPAFDLPVRNHLDIQLVPDRVNVRNATEQDVDFITRIYNEVVLTSPAVAYYEERAVSEKAQWLSKLNTEGWTCLIAEQDGVPLGYLSFTDYGENGQASCFRNAGYVSAFMHPMARKQGVGEILFKHLLRHPVMARHGIRYLIAVHAANSAGLSAVLKAGFVHAVTIDQTNVKFGTFIASTWWQKSLPLQKVQQDEK